MLQGATPQDIETIQDQAAPYLEKLESVTDLTTMRKAICACFKGHGFLPAQLIYRRMLAKLDDSKKEKLDQMLAGFNLGSEFLDRFAAHAHQCERAPLTASSSAAETLTRENLATNCRRI